MPEDLSESYLRFKNTIVIAALRNIICEEKYSKKDILQFRYNCIIDTIPETIDRQKLKDDFSDMERTEYLHIDKITEKLFSKINIKLRTGIEIRRSKVLGKETIFDEKIIEEQGRLLGIINRNVNDYRVRSNMVLPIDFMEEISTEDLNKFDKYQIHAFTKDIHRYLPKNGLISLIEMYVISILAECINGRTVGIMDKAISLSKRKATEKLKLIEEAVMCPEKEELINLICIQELFDLSGDRYENATIKTRAEIDKYWIYIFPIVQLLLDGTLTPEDRKAEKNDMWEKIKDEFFDIVLNRYMIDLSDFYFSEEYAMCEKNLEEAFDLYFEIKLIINEIKVSVLNIVKKLPIFQILN